MSAQLDMFSEGDGVDCKITMIGADGQPVTFHGKAKILPAPLVKIPELTQWERMPVPTRPFLIYHYTDTNMRRIVCAKNVLAAWLAKRPNLAN